MKSFKKSAKYVRRCWKNVCIVFFNEKNLIRDAIILSALILCLGMILVFNWLWQKNRQKSEVTTAPIEQVPASEEESVKKEDEIVKKIQSQIDTSNWTPYQNTWYGFLLKYPDSWPDPIIRKGSAGETWEQKVQFRSQNISEDNPFEGFDVIVYSLAKTKELSATDEFPKLQSEEMTSREDCSDITGHLLETGDYPAEEIYMPANDACYSAALFFTNTRGNYIYNISPKIKEGMGLAGDPAAEIESHMPEFFSIAANWDLTDIRRPKLASPAKPKISAPMPYSYKVVSGKRVCAKKNDHPGKSTKHKGKHMDMECCLDPDEYPNPNCYYDPQKYGKYL